MAGTGKARGTGVSAQDKRVAEEARKRAAATGGQKYRPAGETKTQARRKALQLNETGKAWARGELDSDLKPATGLGPAGKVELREAREGLQSLKEEEQRQAEAVLPRELVALRHIMDRDRWQEAVQRWCEQFSRESEDRAFQRGYQAAQGSGEQVKAQGSVHGAEQAPKERSSLSDLTGWAAPNVPEKGVWAELENLRHQVLKAHQGAETLAERLGGVLVPAEELVATRVAGPTPPSRLSEEVHLVAVSVVQVQDLLERLLTRLDL